MIVEQRTYTLHPGQHNNYLELYEAEGLPIQLPILGHLVGYYFTDIGPLNQIIHMWGYRSLDERALRRKNLFEDKNWLAYIEKVRPMIVSQESKILLPTPFFKPSGLTP
ncbi:MAG: NIPSNAP family protein [Rhodospirillaceae bacterium]|nr:NIPSNAP family protein [Rhodospirillaceae bacterium]|tara:strand:- start:255 stop:581 length:327 start_codon:yes stop_codon:yes gene_type:complete